MKEGEKESIRALLENHQDNFNVYHNHVKKQITHIKTDPGNEHLLRSEISSLFLIQQKIKIRVAGHEEFKLQPK